MHNCSHCGTEFSEIRSVNRHLRNFHKLDIPTKQHDANYYCGECNASFTKSNHLLRHVRTQHESPQPHKCRQCPTFFATLDNLKLHVANLHNIISEFEDPAVDDPIVPTEHNHAIKKFFQSFRITPDNETDLWVFMQANKHRITAFTNQLIRQTGSIKLMFQMAVQLVHPFKGDEIIMHASSFARPLLISFDDDSYYAMLDEMMSSLQVFCSSGSGWTVDKLLHLDININRYSPIRGSSYIATPQRLVDNHFLLNIKNNDQLCFLYSVLASTNNEMLSNGRHMNKSFIYEPLMHQLDYKGFSFPMAVGDIPKFEKRNDLCINVFGYKDDNGVIPLHLSSRTGRVVNLLLLHDGISYHYTLITNFNAFMMKQTQSASNQKTRYFCQRCLHGFHEKKNLIQHRKLCGEHSPIRIDMPSEGSFVEFTDYQKQLPCHFVVYADTEAICPDVSACRGDPSNSYTM